MWGDLSFSNSYLSGIINTSAFLALDDVTKTQYLNTSFVYISANPRYTIKPTETDTNVWAAQSLYALSLFNGQDGMKRNELRAGGVTRVELDDMLYIFEIPRGDEKNLPLVVQGLLKQYLNSPNIATTISRHERFHHRWFC